MFRLEEYGDSNSLQSKIHLEYIQSLFPPKDLANCNNHMDQHLDAPFPQNKTKPEKERFEILGKGTKAKNTSKKRSRSTLGANKTVKRLYSSTAKAFEQSTLSTNPKKRHLNQLNAKLDMVVSTRNKPKISTLPPPPPPASYIANSLQSRTYITEGYATLSQGSHSAQRYIFLFNDWLIIAKSKANNVFHLKKKVRVAEIWIASYTNGIADVNQGLELSSFIIGWPTVNSVITFGSVEICKYWWESLQRIIKSQCEKEEPKMTTLKIFNWNLDSPIKAKTMQIKYDQTATECLENAIKLFGVSQMADVQLWVQNQKKGRATELYGEERPYAIIMNHIRKVSGGSGPDAPRLPFCYQDDASSRSSDPASNALTTMIKEAGITPVTAQGVDETSNTTLHNKKIKPEFLPFQFQQLLEGNLSTMCCQFSLRTKDGLVPAQSFNKGPVTLPKQELANKQEKRVTTTALTKSPCAASQPKCKRSPKVAMLGNVNLSNWTSFKWNLHRPTYHNHLQHLKGGSQDKTKTLNPSHLPSNDTAFSHKLQMIMPINFKSQNAATLSSAETWSKLGTEGLIFCRPLSDIMINRGQDLPRPIKKILQLLYTYGPYTVGIFRKSASAKLCKLVKEQLNAGIDVKLDDVPMLALATLFKDFLRNIPNSLMDSNMYEEWANIQYITNEATKFSKCKSLISKLPEPNRLLLGHTLRIFKSIHDNSDYNNMTAINLGICVGQSLLWHHSLYPLSNHSLVTAHKSSKVTDLNPNATLGFLPDDGTKIIPLLLEYMIQHITTLIPSVAKISSSFKIKFNSSRQKKKVIRRSPLMSLNLEKEVIDPNELTAVTYFTNSNNTSICSAEMGQKSCSLLQDSACLDNATYSSSSTTTRMPIVPPKSPAMMSFARNVVLTTQSSSLSSPSSALSLPATLSRLLSPSPEAKECSSNQSKQFFPIVIPKLSVNGFDVREGGSSPLFSADPFNDYFASDFGVSLSSLETKYDFNTKISQKCDVHEEDASKEHHLSLREPLYLVGTSDRSQSTINSCSQTNSNDRMDSIGDADSFHSLQDNNNNNKKIDFQRYDSSIDSLEVTDKDDIYIYSKSLYHNHCPYFLPEISKRKQHFSKLPVKIMEKNEGQCYVSQVSPPQYGRQAMGSGGGDTFKNSKRSTLGNEITIVSPLTSSSRDSGLTMSDSNLYNTEPELDEEGGGGYGLGNDDPSLRTSLSNHGCSLSASPSYLFRHLKQRTSLRQLGLDVKMPLTRRILLNRGLKHSSEPKSLHHDKRKDQLERAEPNALIDKAGSNSKADVQQNEKRSTAVRSKNDLSILPSMSSYPLICDHLSSHQAAMVVHMAKGPAPLVGNGHFDPENGGTKPGRKKSCTHAEISISYISPWEREIFIKDQVGSNHDASAEYTETFSNQPSPTIEKLELYPNSTVFKGGCPPSLINSEKLMAAQSQKSFEARKVYENSLKLYLKSNHQSVPLSDDRATDLKVTLPIANLQVSGETSSISNTVYGLRTIDDVTTKMSNPKGLSSSGEGNNGTWSVSQLTQLFANMTPSNTSPSGDFLAIRQASRIRSSASFYKKT